MWFKKLLSHFFELPITQSKSEFNPVLEVSMASGRYKLSTETATYSFEDHS